MTEGVRKIADERRHQIEKGWSSTHDNEQHYTGELKAAAAHLLEDEDFNIIIESGHWTDPGNLWIQELYRRHHDKPLKRLVVAGALIAAEIDRLIAMGVTE